MNAWTLLHLGALGDLALFLRCLTSVRALCTAPDVLLISSAEVGCTPPNWKHLYRTQPEAACLHELFSNPGPRIQDRLRGRQVISALNDPDHPVCQRILECEPAAVYCMDPRPRVGSARHITAQWRDDLAAQGLEFERTFECPVPPALRARGEPQVLVHPGSGGLEKCWPVANFERLAATLRATCDVRFVLGPAELDRTPQIETRLAATAPVLIPASVSELADCLSQADLSIGNDAGPAHLAALLDTPTLTVFGPTSATVWAPLTRFGTLLQGDPAAGPGLGNHRPAPRTGRRRPAGRPDARTRCTRRPVNGGG